MRCTKPSSRLKFLYGISDESDILRFFPVVISPTTVETGLAHFYFPQRNHFQLLSCSSCFVHYNVDYSPRASDIVRNKRLYLPRNKFGESMLLETIKTPASKLLFCEFYVKSSRQSSRNLKSDLEALSGANSTILVSFSMVAIEGPWLCFHARFAVRTIHQHYSSNQLETLLLFWRWTRAKNPIKPVMQMHESSLVVTAANWRERERFSSWEREQLPAA